MISNFTRNSNIIDIDKNIDISCQSSRNQSGKKKKKNYYSGEWYLYSTKFPEIRSIFKRRLSRILLSLKGMKIIRKNLEWDPILWEEDNWRSIVYSNEERSKNRINSCGGVGSVGWNVSKAQPSLSSTQLTIPRGNTHTRKREREREKERPRVAYRSLAETTRTLVKQPPTGVSSPRYWPNSESSLWLYITIIIQ